MHCGAFAYVVEDVDLNFNTRTCSSEPAIPCKSLVPKYINERCDSMHNLTDYQTYVLQAFAFKCDRRATRQPIFSVAELFKCPTFPPSPMSPTPAVTQKRESGMVLVLDPQALAVGQLLHAKVIANLAPMPELLLKFQRQAIS